MNIKSFRFLLPLVVFFYACGSDEQPWSPVTPPAKGAYVLSEGSFSALTKLGAYDVETGQVTGNYFGQQNGGGELGQFGNDMFIYGSKLYIVMNGSNNLTVLNAANGSLIQRVQFNNAAYGQYPRFGIARFGNIYISCQNNKVAVLDTTSFSFIASINVGTNPEQMAFATNKVFAVANSGGFNYPNYDSTISFVNMDLNTEIQKVKIGLNPVNIISDDAGNLFVGSYGNYWNVGPKITRIDGATRVITHSVDSAAGRMAVHKGRLYVAANGRVTVFDAATLSVVRKNFITDGTIVANPYGVYVDINNDNVWITDAKDYVSSGHVYIFNSDGVKQNSFSTNPGINPNTIVFKR